MRLPGGCAYRRSASLLFGGEVFGGFPWLGFDVVFGGVKQSSDAKAHRENGETHVAKIHFGRSPNCPQQRHAANGGSTSADSPVVD
jgi:hypothetical protein